MTEFRPLEIIVASAVLATSILAGRAVTYATAREPNPHLNYYPETGIVVSVEQGDLVEVEVSTGNLYLFEADGYSVGNVVSMIMDDNDTKDLRDDAIISTRYVGEWLCTK